MFLATQGFLAAGTCELFGDGAGLFPLGCTLPGNLLGFMSEDLMRSVPVFGFFSNRRCASSKYSLARMGLKLLPCGRPPTCSKTLSPTANLQSWASQPVLFERLQTPPSETRSCQKLVFSVSCRPLSAPCTVARLAQISRLFGWPSRPLPGNQTCCKQ